MMVAAKAKLLMNWKTLNYHVLATNSAALKKKRWDNFGFFRTSRELSGGQHVYPFEQSIKSNQVNEIYPPMSFIQSSLKNESQRFNQYQDLSLDRGENPRWRLAIVSTHWPASFDWQRVFLCPDLRIGWKNGCNKRQINDFGSVA